MQENNSQDVLNEESVIVNQPLLLGAIDRILTKKSIARRVSDIQQLKGPTGIITGAEWDKATDTLKIAKADIIAATKKIRTEFTKEAIQDLKGIYDESFYDLLAHYLVDEMSYQIDADFITMVSDRAEDKNGLVFPGANYNENLLSLGRSIAIKVTKELANLPISDNRSPIGWAIVSSNIASVLGLTTNVNENVEMVDGENERDKSPSYLGKLNGVDYYIDYTHTPAPEVVEVPAVAQINTVTLGALVDATTYSITVNGTEYSLQYLVATHTNVAGYATALAALVDANTDVSATASTNVITVTALAAGTSYTISTSDALLVLLETQANVVYIAPVAEVLDSVIFGLKGNGISKGSTIYAPYRQDWISTVDPSTGEDIFFLMHRSGMTINPLDEKYYNAGAGSSAFLGKFSVDLSDLAIFA
jgi:hypothetical protein